MSHFSDMDDESREMIIEESSLAFLDMMNDVASRLVWDIFISLMNPDAATLDRILNAMAKAAVDKIREDLWAEYDVLDADDVDFCTDVNDKAIAKALEMFKRSRKVTIITPELAEEAVEAISKNVISVALGIDLSKNTFQ